MFATVTSSVFGAAGLAVEEERRTVFRDEVKPALTFNSHRIHYDRAWAMEVEGYPRPAGNGRCELWAVTPEGTVAMSAEVELA